MRVTVDLDDTLIHTQQDYDEAISLLGEWISKKTDADPDEVASRLNEIDRQNLEEYGLSKERFPHSFIQATKEFSPNPSKSELGHAEKLAKKAYKKTSEYQDRGFRDCAKELLLKLKRSGATIHLLTAGDDDIQQRKIQGLNLTEYVDKVSIVGLGEKEDFLEELNRDAQIQSVLHIGNSLSSDVETARNAGVEVIYIPNGEWRNSMIDQNIFQDDGVHIYSSIRKFLSEFESFIPNIEKQQQYEETVTRTQYEKLDS
jgi:FMN phosphatase YigB (HAD superfamily)